MGKPKGKKREQSQQNQEESDKQYPNEDFPVDEEVTLPSQEHCTWLLNIIRLHAKEISSEQVAEFELKSQQQIHKLIQQIEDLKKELLVYKASMEDGEVLKLENAKKQRRIDSLEYENSKRQTEIHSLKLKIDQLEQRELESSMQIVGLPEAKDEKEDLKQFIKLTKDRLGVKIKSNNIVAMHRLGKKKDDGKARNIIVKFSDKRAKETVHVQRKKLIKSGSPEKSIFLNDSIKMGDITKDHEEQGLSRLSSRDTSIVSHLSNYEYFCESD